MTAPLDPSDLELVVGAPNIAARLKITYEQFRNARFKGGLKFVWKEPGLGLTTSLGAIRRYQEAKAQGVEPPPVPLDKAG